MKTLNARQCPKCGFEGSTVEETRYTQLDRRSFRPEDRILYRVRCCTRCNYRWRTAEIDLYDAISAIRKEKEGD